MGRRQSEIGSLESQIKRHRKLRDPHVAAQDFFLWVFTVELSSASHLHTLKHRPRYSHMVVVRETSLVAILRAPCRTST